MRFLIVRLRDALFTRPARCISVEEYCEYYAQTPPRSPSRRRVVRSRDVRLSKERPKFRTEERCFLVFSSAPFAKSLSFWRIQKVPAQVQLCGCGVFTAVVERGFGRGRHWQVVRARGDRGALKPRQVQKCVVWELSRRRLLKKATKTASH